MMVRPILYKILRQHHKKLCPKKGVYCSRYLYMMQNYSLFSVYNKTVLGEYPVTIVLFGRRLKIVVAAGILKIIKLSCRVVSESEYMMMKRNIRKCHKLFVIFVYRIRWKIVSFYFSNKCLRSFHVSFESCCLTKCESSTFG